jgi:uncharacterized NAD-dependent epimerase/dehydratase family protein
VVLQHAPARRDYDGFEGYPIQPIPQQIHAVELISGRPVVAVTINSEGISDRDVPGVCRSIELETGLPAVEVLRDGPDRVAQIIIDHLEQQPRNDPWQSKQRLQRAAG